MIEATSGRTAWMLAAAAALVLACGCGLLSRAEERPAQLEELPVVEGGVEEGTPFDPSQAVDDEDEFEKPWRRRQDRLDADPFASGGAPRGSGTAPAPGSGALRDAARDVRTGDETSKARRRKPPSGEHVATESEVDALVRERRQQLERATRERGSDDAAKARAARNPPAQEVGKAKPVTWTILDYTLEAVLLAAGALVLTALVALFERFPRAIGGGAAAAVLAIAAIVFFQRE